MVIKKEKCQPETEALRRRADDRLKSAEAKQRQTWSEYDRQRLLHELDVHQIELEMQNEELRKSRDELEISHNVFTELYDFAPVGYLTMDREGVIRSSNLTFSRLLNVDRSQLIGRRFAKFISSESRAIFSDYLVKLFTSRGKETCDVMISSEDIASPYIVQIDAMVTDSGEVCRAAIIDVTARKSAEEALRNSEQLYRAIGESIEYGVWVCTPDGRNIYASESFLRMVGYTQEQCSDFGWKDVLHPDDAERTIAAWQECVLTHGSWDIEHRIRSADGQWNHVLARGVPVKNQQGEIICWAGINLDINRIKQAEERILAYAEEMRVANEVLLRFNNAAVGREMRMVELKEEVNKLCAESGQPHRYPLDFEKA